MKKLIWRPEDSEAGWIVLSDAFDSRDPMKLEKFFDWISTNARDGMFDRRFMNRLHRENDKEKAFLVYRMTMMGYDPLTRLIGKSMLVLMKFVTAMGCGGLIYFLLQFIGILP